MLEKMISTKLRFLQIDISNWSWNLQMEMWQIQLGVSNAAWLWLQNSKPSAEELVTKEEKKQNGPSSYTE